METAELVRADMETTEDTTALLTRGDAAFVEERLGEALELYNRAVAAAEAPSGDSAFAAVARARRSAVFSHLGKYQDAVADAEAATAAQPELAWAWYRRGLALRSLKKWRSASEAFSTAAASTEREKERLRYRSLADSCAARADADESPAIPAPPVKTLRADPPRRKAPEQRANPALVPTATASTDVDALRREAKLDAAPHAGPKTRHEWFQNATHVVVTIFAKGVVEERSEVSIRKRSLSVTLARPSGPDFSLELDLCDSVAVDESTRAFTPYKVEIAMRKEVPGVTWPSLERPTVEAVPSGQTSSAKKNWDKIAADEGADDEGDQLQKLFQKIYENADDDTRRAMNKSYQESGGKVLSTNWSEVKSKKVEYKERTEETNQ